MHSLYRTVRWLDRCLAAHARDNDQSVFPIVQGGLDTELRKICSDELLQRQVRGYAVGGLRYSNFVNLEIHTRLVIGCCLNRMRFLFSHFARDIVAANESLTSLESSIFAQMSCLKTNHDI